MLSLFIKPKYKLSGCIKIQSLPVNYGLIVDLAFFKINSLDDPVPYGGDPPSRAVKDVLEVARTVDLKTPREGSTEVFPFAAIRKRSLYYLQVRVIAFRKKGDGSAVAQTEQFFFAKRPLPLAADIGDIELAVTWPDTPIEGLATYGKVFPQ